MTTASSGYSTVAGGFDNTASGSHSTVAGGLQNTASGFQSTVAGGDHNTASGQYSTVAGGFQNTASSIDSTVGGGFQNTASGSYSTVAGGTSNTASGAYSFAAGVRAKATHERSFVWGGDLSIDTLSQSDGGFVVYAPSGIRMYAGPVGAGGCVLTSGAGGWLCSSDRALKSQIVNVDGNEVLERVAALPIARWSFTSVPDVMHMGPMAQDFHATFGLGDDPTRLGPMDVQGVALAAIQGLNAKLETRIAEQAREIAELKQAFARLLGAIQDADRIASRAP